MGDFERNGVDRRIVRRAFEERRRRRARGQRSSWRERSRNRRGNPVTGPVVVELSDHDDAVGAPWPRGRVVAVNGGGLGEGGGGGEDWY